MITEPGTRGSSEFHNAPKKDQTPGEVQTPGQDRMQTHGKEKKFPALQPAPTHKLGMMPMVRNISVGQLGYLSSYAPPHLLHTCSLAKHGKLEKGLDFLETTENQCYQHSSCTKSKTQQVLGGKLALSQLKPGHSLWEILMNMSFRNANFTKSTLISYERKALSY